MMSGTEQLEEFQDFFLRGPANGRPALRRALLDRVVAPWRHAEEIEKELSKNRDNDADVLAFQREATEGLEAATLVLWPQSDGYKVMNIVPREISELGYSRYNALLQDFERRIAAPAARQFGFQMETTAACQSLDDWLSPKAAETLRDFSKRANKATGSAHPLDRERWFQFLIEAHADHGQLDAERLVRWLVEVEGWGDDQANDLAIEYEFGLALLSEYDRRRS